MPIDTGDTAWMLVAGSLVLLMIPALGLFESGLLRKKNAVSVFMQIFFGLALLSVMWFVFGFSLSFG
ncbi:MAG: ammonia channel protein, partial [Candidatus Nitrosomaritimum yanchengensis]